MPSLVYLAAVREVLVDGRTQVSNIRKETERHRNQVCLALMPTATGILGGIFFSFQAANRGSSTPEAWPSRSSGTKWLTR